MNTPIIIGFAGLSESGKSHAGKYLEEQHNIKRVKIVKYFERLRVDIFPDLSLDELHELIYSNENTLSHYFLKKICLDIINDNKHEKIISLESLRNPTFGVVLKELHQHTYFVYFNVDFFTRYLREKHKTGLEEQQIMNLTYTKDIEKIDAGAKYYKSLADVTFENNQSIDVLNSFLDNLVNNYTSK